MCIIECIIYLTLVHLTQFRCLQFSHFFNPALLLALTVGRDTTFNSGNTVRLRVQENLSWPYDTFFWVQLDFDACCLGKEFTSCFAFLIQGCFTEVLDIDVLVLTVAECLFFHWISLAVFCSIFLVVLFSFVVLFCSISLCLISLWCETNSMRVFSTGRVRTRYK